MGLASAPETLTHGCPVTAAATVILAPGGAIIRYVQKPPLAVCRTSPDTALPDELMRMSDSAVVPGTMEKVRTKSAAPADRARLRVQRRASSRKGIASVR